MKRFLYCVMISERKAKQVSTKHLSYQFSIYVYFIRLRPDCFFNSFSNQIYIQTIFPLRDKDVTLGHISMMWFYMTSSFLGGTSLFFYPVHILYGVINYSDHQEAAFDQFHLIWGLPSVGNQMLFYEVQTLPGIDLAGLYSLDTVHQQGSKSQCSANVKKKKSFLRHL